MIQLLFHTKHYVSVKLVMYSHDKKRVLVMRYPSRSGLPGGHLDAKETPDQALQRELHEELGISVKDFKRVDFFLRGRKGNSVILGYIAIAPKNLKLNPPRPHKEYGEWVTRDELASINMSENYKAFILENWPSS